MERLTIVISLFLSLPVIIADDFSRCPPAVKPIKYFRTFRNHCYEFATYRQDYWADAQAQCHHKQGRLATVSDLATQQFFIRALNNLHYTSVGIWIGLNDRQTESHYEWVSGEPVAFTYWASGQPASVLGGVQDCVLMKYAHGFHWFDHPCRLWPEYFSFICEYDMLPTTSPAVSKKLTNPTTTSSTTRTAFATASTASTQVTTQPTNTPPKTTPGHCPELVCSLDCGLLGFKLDQVTGCTICACANTDP